MKKTLLTTDQLFVWLNAEGRLLKPIAYPRMVFWLQTRRVPPTEKVDGRNFYSIAVAAQVAELIRAFQLVKSSIQWRPDRGRRKREANLRTVTIPI